MSLDLYTINDIIRFEFFKLPKALFANPKYKTMSSDAKLTYSLLYDRLSLSKQNNWINEKNEVFLIFTREGIADALGITYKKAMAAFAQLIKNGLIFEKRCGRGMANKIYIVKPEVTAAQAKEYDPNCQPGLPGRQQGHPCRTAEMEGLEAVESVDKSNGDKDLEGLDVPKEPLLNCSFGSSETADTDVQELPNRDSNQTYLKKTYTNHTENSQSVYAGMRTNFPQIGYDGQNDDDNLQEILENCQLEYFDEETRVTFRDAIERLWFCERFKIGNAILPQANVRSRMNRLGYSILETALHNLHQNKERDIKNITAYVMSTIFNCIAEEFSLLVVDPYLNQIRAPYQAASSRFAEGGG